MNKTAEKILKAISSRAALLKNARIKRKKTNQESKTNISLIVHPKKLQPPTI